MFVGYLNISKFSSDSCFYGTFVLNNYKLLRLLNNLKCFTKKNNIFITNMKFVSKL